MTILFFARRFYPEIGGVEKHVLEIGKRLVKKGHKVIVITENPQKTHSDGKQSSPESAMIAGKVEGIEIYRINGGKSDWFKKFRLWKELWGLVKIISDADIVHCHDVFFWYLPFRFLFPEKKVFTTFHGYEGNYIPGKKAILMHKLSEKLSNGNICVGDFLKKWYGTKPSVVIYGATEIPDFKKRNNINVDKNLIVFLGRLEKETGIMEYLKAFYKLSKRHKDLRLEVLGDGALMTEAREYVASNHLVVNFRGFIEDTAKYVERASFVFVSRYLGILETMASKKYVLSVYNNKIMEDYLKMAPFSSFISISSNFDDIYKELERILTNSKLKDAQISKAYEWVKDKTWEKLTDIYLDLWVKKK
jgi:glycosyltransferase involved in cell wall biosynthesis